MSTKLANFVTSVTEEEFLPTVVDNFYEGNVLFMRMKDKKKGWSSGARLNIPTEVKGRTQGGSYAGADTFGTAQEDVRQQFTIDPSQYYWTATLTGIQAAANRGKRAIVDLVAEELRSTSMALKDRMGDDIYGDGTGNSSKNLTGLVAHVDDGTNVSTYQNLSRTTYPTLKSTLTAQSGSLGLDDLAADFDAAQIGSDQPTLGLTTPAVFSIYEALLTQNSRYQIVQDAGRFQLTAAGIERAGINANAGFTGLMFRGMPIVSDDKCPSGNLFMLNENYLDLYEMEMDPAFVSGNREGFAWTGWKKSTNQDALVGQFLWYGELVGKQPRKHSRRTGISS